MRILIIEDEFNLADVIKSRLEKEKYIVDICTDGLEGLYNILTNAYDLVILDVMLPGMNGFEILDNIKNKNIDSKIIMLTAKSTLEDKLNGKSTTYKNIFLYQSMIGDADTGVSTFTSKNSKITTNKGDTFYITNTSSEINLENNTITNNDSIGSFLRAQADSWGNTGSNGGTVTLNMTNQKAVGNIVIDSISTLTMNLTNKSYYEGVINSDNKLNL